MSMNEHISEILRLDALCFPDEPLGERRLLAFLDIGTMAYKKDVGYILLHQDEEICTVVRIGVVPQRRREGHATKMLLDLFADMTTPITLRVEKGNPALLLYKKLGFVLEAHTKDHLLLTYEPTQTDSRTPYSEIGSYPLVERAPQHPHT